MFSASCSRLVLEQGWSLWSSCDCPDCGDTAVSVLGCDVFRLRVLDWCWNRVGHCGHRVNVLTVEIQLSLS